MLSRYNLAYGFIDALIAAVVFIVIPLYLLPVVENYLGVAIPLTSLPYLGVIMVVASFFSGICKKTKLEGAAVIFWSAVTIIYLSYIFWGGRFEASANTSAGEMLSMKLNFPYIFYILLAIPVIGIARGVAMLVYSNNERPKANKSANIVERREEQVDLLPPHSD